MTCRNAYGTRRHRKKGAVPFRTMKKEDLRYLRELAYYASIGLSVSLSIFIGLGVGVYLDGKFDCRPWLTLIGLGLGIAAGYRNIGLAIRKSRKF